MRGRSMGAALIAAAATVVGPVVANAPAAGVGTGSGSGVTTRPIDGGPSYFAGKSPASGWMDGHVLLGAWDEQPLTAAEVASDAAIGDNIYWNLAGTPGVDRVDYDLIRAGGMHVVAPSADGTTGSETVGYQGADEADLNFGPGASGWVNNGIYNESACSPAGTPCGFTVANWYDTGSPSTDGATPYPIDGRVINQGFGKGVLFWEPDAQASRFVTYSDILSADSYWLTDRDLRLASQGGCALLPASAVACGNYGGVGLTAAQAALPANYAWNVARLEHLQSLVGASKPVVVDVETGCPFSSGASLGDCATPPQTIAAAWHALIAGARGIIWFQHNFSGPCIDFRTLLDGSNPASSMYNCQQTPGVTLHNLVQALTAFDSEVTSLNGVLLSPTVTNYVSTTGDVSTMTKAYGGSCYVFAGAGTPANPPPTNQAVTLNLADGYTGTVSVVGENRTLLAVLGSLTDTFADANAVHIYKLSGSAC